MGFGGLMCELPHSLQSGKKSLNWKNRNRCSAKWETSYMRMLFLLLHDLHSIKLLALKECVMSSAIKYLHNLRLGRDLPHWWLRLPKWRNVMLHNFFLSAANSSLDLLTKFFYSNERTFKNFWIGALLREMLISRHRQKKWTRTTRIIIWVCTQAWS